MKVFLSSKERRALREVSAIESEVAKSGLSKTVCDEGFFYRALFMGQSITKILNCDSTGKLRSGRDYPQARKSLFSFL